MGTRHLLLIRHLRQVITVSTKNVNSNGNAKCGIEDMNDIALLENTEEGMDIAVGSDGNIIDIFDDRLLAEKYCSSGVQLNDVFCKIVDGRGCSAIPGFVDCHSHSCWAGDRLNEFVMKLNGATYLDVHKMGGGIHYSVRCTKEASEDSLMYDLEKRLLSMIACGTTTLEIKSGYGLDTETELKMLRVINKAKKKFADKIHIVATFCGAHAVPQGDNPANATDRIINEMLPAIVKSKDITVDGGIDVFCERGIFENEHSRKILEAGMKIAQLPANFHGDELSCTNSAELAVEMKARAVSHLEEISDEGIAALARSCSGNSLPTVAVLLPTTAYLLRLKIPPARKMIDSGACVALGSDFNPNAYCYNMPLVMNLACVFMRMTPAEALCAATINSACALGLSEKIGRLEPGRLADLVILETPRWENLIYQVGCSNEIIRNVVKGGNIVYTRPV